MAAVPPGQFIAKGIVSTTAIQTNKASYVFYSREDAGGTLSYLYYEGQESAPTETTEPQYKHLTIHDQDLNPFQASAPQMAACCWEYDGSYQIRLYYIEAGNYLRELCYREGDDRGWIKGSLDNGEIIADASAPLSVSVSEGDVKQLKLYYTRPDKPGMWCTWCSLNTQAWHSRNIS